MGIIYVLIPIAVLLSAVGIYLFFWAVKTDQFSDLEKQGLSILFDDETTENKSTSESEDTTETKDKDKQEIDPS
ncbi:cbb3-type cytochrome oxidase assembly protein CcoS [Thalassotalea piscium]